MPLSPWNPRLLYFLEHLCFSLPSLLWPHIQCFEQVWLTSCLRILEHTALYSGILFRFLQGCSFWSLSLMKSILSGHLPHSNLLFSVGVPCQFMILLLHDFLSIIVYICFFPSVFHLNVSSFSMRSGTSVFSSPHPLRLEQSLVYSRYKKMID